jgi:glycosyltransferase involved in cell wall biosynthesis
LRVSVLVTNYNYARYIGPAIESALAQSWPVAEVVSVDDGSTDDSRQVIEAVAGRHPGRVVTVFQANAGQAAAINAGFERCTGSIVCMLDGDDVWDPMKVERVAAAFEAEPEAAMVMHRLRHIDGAGGVTRDTGCGWRPGGDLGRLMIATGGTWVFGATSSLSFSRGALEEILPIPAEKWRLCTDGALAYAAAFLGPTVSLDDVLGGYRIHGANNFTGVRPDAAKVQADVEMTNGYINDFLTRIGRPERVDLLRNLHYRRDRFYRNGGGPREALAIARLIIGWPLYGPVERAKYLARFVAKAALTRPRQAAKSPVAGKAHV